MQRYIKNVKFQNKKVFIVKIDKIIFYIMKKFKISDKQYQNLINESINSSIYLIEGEKRVDDKFISGFRDDITNRINNKLANDQNLRQSADELGINPNYSDKEKMQVANSLFNMNGNISPIINDEVKTVVDILRDHTNENGSIDLIKIRNNANKGLYTLNDKPLSYAKIMRIKDFIDANSLRYLYDPSTDPKVLAKFGIEQGSRDASTFDINNINDAQFNDWYGEKRKDKIPMALAPLQMKYSVLEKYLQSAYGIKFEAPTFPLGNDKVVDALMINFTSAYRCPAWNECLVKHACYARAGETRHYDLSKVSNDKKNLMWLACDGDPEMIRLMYNLLKAYVVDWTKVGELLTKNPMASKLINGRSKVGVLSKMMFNEIPTQILDLIKQCKRVSYIRLNENGDFINQKLLETFDTLAEDFKLIDVKTAAYSCRNLNFKGIKNILINASRINMEGPTIQRYFYAVPVKMYDAFPDTYTAMQMSNSFDSIGKTPLPLFSVDANGNKRPNGSFYYKCPCNRKDFSLVNKNGEVTENSKVNCYQCHLCYEENDDSIKEQLKNGGKFFVFVKAHGSFANVLDQEREEEIIRTVGVPENYKVGMRDTGVGYSNDLDVDDDVVESKGTTKNIITENTSLQNEAYNEITKNAIYSMTEHFGNFRSGMIESNENFFSLSVDKILNEKKLRTES